MLIAVDLALNFFFHTFIAWQDHVGGLLAGALLTARTCTRRARPTAIQVAATVAVVALMAITVIVRPPALHHQQPVTVGGAPEEASRPGQALGQRHLGRATLVEDRRPR